MTVDNHFIAEGLKLATKFAHERSASAGWWTCPHTGNDLLDNKAYAPYVIATKLALIMSETVEALEGARKDAMDDKLPNRSMLEVELVDVLLRVFDLAGKLDLDLAGAWVEKSEFNSVRPDHNIANRLKPNGKKF